MNLGSQNGMVDGSLKQKLISKHLTKHLKELQVVREQATRFALALIKLTIFQPARPLKDKAMLSATNYSLGDDRTIYKSAAMSQFQHPQKQLMKEQPTYKNYNQRVDIITGQVYDQNKRSYTFEGYSDEPQHKRSQNQTILPSDLYVTDPITGRKIIRV
eukprot:403363074